MRSQQEEACATLWRHWQEGDVLDALPDALRPATRADGYAIQACFERYSAKPLAGWKIAATSAAGQKHINVDGPLAGRLLAERLHDNGAELSIADNRMRVCEPEFGFRFGADLLARSTPYEISEVMANVADLHLTLELPDSRYTDFTLVGGPSLIADNACARDLVVGAAVTANWRDLDLSRQGVSARVAGRYNRQGSGANVLGGPSIALTWLVNELSGLGVGVRSGELVTTGTSMVPLEIEPGDRIEVDYGSLGLIGVSIEP